MKKIYILKIVILITMLKANAQFSPPVIIDNVVSGSVRNIITGDLNNDNLDDIIVSHFQNNILWYRNNGAGFDSPQNISTNVPLPYHLNVADVNNDNFMDLLVTNNSNNNSGAFLFLNNNAGQSWTEILIEDSLELGAFKSFFTDVENDNDQDIVINGDTKINLYINDGNGQFSSPFVIENMNEYYSMTVGDFNNDTFEDLIVNTAEPGTILFTNNTSGTFNPPVTIDNGLCIFLASSDIDNDGDIDMLRGNPDNISEIQFYTNNAGNFNFSHNESNVDALDATNTKSQMTDLDSDNFDDILFIRNQEIFWKRNTQTGTFNNGELIDNTYLYHSVYANDIDNDGDKDVIWFGFDEPSSTLLLGYFENTNTSSPVMQAIENKVAVYPNPADKTINIDSDTKFEKIELYNSRGEKIMNIKNEFKDISGLTNGIYFLIFEEKDKVKKKIKLIKN